MLSRFVACTNGNFGMLTAIGLVPILAAVAGAIDYAGLLNKASMVQSGLDAAALAAATEHKLPASDERAEVARNVFAANLSWRGGSVPSFEYSDDLDETGKITVKASASFKHDGMIGWDFWKAERLAKASLEPSRSACMLALHPSANSAIHMTGSTELNLQNCVMAANSSSSSAVTSQGAATLRAECVVTVGSASGLNSRTALECAEPVQLAPITADPLAALSPPGYTACQSVPNTDPKALTPGTYCNQSFSGNVQLSPGNYILRGGQISLGGGGSLIGDNVTIFLLNGASMTLSGNETVKLSAPETGPYAGILLYQGRDNGNVLNLTGGSESSISGFVYAPAAHVKFRGNAALDGEGECIRIVASTMDFSGRSDFKTDCGGRLGGKSILSSERFARLIR